MEIRFFIENNQVAINDYKKAFKTGYYLENLFIDESDSRSVIKKLTYSENEKNKTLRKKRHVIFMEGFEPYKSSVQYGIITETPEQHQEIINWYNNMLDIDKLESAIKNIPEGILYYLGGLKND